MTFRCPEGTRWWASVVQRVLKAIRNHSQSNKSHNLCLLFMFFPEDGGNTRKLMIVLWKARLACLTTGGSQKWFKIAAKAINVTIFCFLFFFFVCYESTYEWRGWGRAKRGPRPIALLFLLSSVVLLHQMAEPCQSPHQKVKGKETFLLISILTHLFDRRQ